MRTRVRTTAAAVLAMALARESRGGEAARSAPLPPELPWAGGSVALVADAGDPWITPAEASGFTRTPSYDETLEWLRRLAAASPELRLVSLGTSPEGRSIWMVVASRDRTFRHRTAHAAGKPTLLVQAGIHAGEIDGKDAGLMLLRDLTARGTKSGLLDRANLLFVPIVNVDGHERRSAFGRVNQRGPAETGWRTNARNLNLNRDYSKLDAPEIRGVVRALDQWDPELYLDVHVTDGFDYQYDVTFTANGPGGYSPDLAGWLEGGLFPALRRDLTAMGHVPGTMVWPVKEERLEEGLVPYIATPRLAHGYGDARHVASVLVETHALKPYRQRVLGTYVLLESALDLVGREAAEIRAARAADRARRPGRLPLTWRTDPAPEPAEFLGVSSREVPSEVSGGSRTEWTGKPTTLLLPRFLQGPPLTSATRPRAYWVPAAWSDVIERLVLHGIAMERPTEPREVDVEMLRAVEPRLATEAYEGRVAPSADFAPEKRRERFPPGSARVPTDQPLGDLAVLLLDPASPDSFFRWGFFNEILSRAEHVEGYVLDPLAERMMAEDPALASEFQNRLREDPVFAADPKARRRFFYERTPYYDDRYLLYPVARE